jgi:hypothetical protein
MKDINDDKEEKTLNTKHGTASPTSIASPTSQASQAGQASQASPASEPHKDSSKGSVCDSGCDKCSMEMPKKKNIFNEMAIDNFVPYITEENLLAAQTNIIDVYNYNLCINNNDIEILDVKRGALCDIQGLQDIPDLGDTKRLRGYDTYNSRLGNLTYDIL